MSSAGACKSLGRMDSQSSLRARCEINGYGRDCRVLDLTSAGLFVESFVPATKGSEVKLRFRLPNGHQVCTAGVVSFHEFRLGFGVDFTDLSMQDRDQIASLLG